MNHRVQKLAELTLDGKMYVVPVKTEFDRMDTLLPMMQKDAKRICEYIINQEPKLTEYSAFTGFFNFDGSVVGDLFNRSGHRHFAELFDNFYCKHIENLSCMDWQHGTSDYREVLSIGVVGIIEKIDKYIKIHTENDKIEFLKSLKQIAIALTEWMQKCSRLCMEYACAAGDEQIKKNYEKLSQALYKISKSAPQSFYEAVLTIYVTFSMNPDSFGTLDRYLTHFYRNDIKNGVLTREEAKEYLQELFLMVQAVTPFQSSNFTKGGQSHFSIGGRDIHGNDCFNEVSLLIAESLMELPCYIPELTLRWTNDTPRNVLRTMLEYEKNDKNKRIAFTNDDRRIEAYTRLCHFPYEEAVNYSMVGCNEPAMLGGMCATSSHANLVHSVEELFHRRSDEIINTATFDEFYTVFKNQLYADLDKIYHYDDLFHQKRGMDINYVSCLFMNGCIENGISATQGGVNYAVSTIPFLGNVTVIDSLCIIKQFVFDEKIVSMKEMVNALKADWKGYEELHGTILAKGDFFGNDTERSNYVATRFYDDLYEYIKNKKTVHGYPVLFGDHTGYQPHFKWFGECTKATPDGRYSGEYVSYGIFQSGKRARNGLGAQMNAISGFDKRGISSATVTNFTLDESYVKTEEEFEKTVTMLETYFKNGGIHFQLNHVSREILESAQRNPSEHTDLRVRVTGYSDYFTKLDESVQNSVINRYER